MRSALSKLGWVALVVALFCAVVLLQQWRGPRRRSNPDLERKVEEGKRMQRDLERRDRERARRYELPQVDAVDLDEAAERMRRGEPVDFTEGLSPEARKYLPAEHLSRPDGP